jgi:cell surface protein SprA
MFYLQAIEQQQNVQATNNVLLNEQALSLRACNLKDGDSRAIIKNTELDVRSFGKMKLFMHAEKLRNRPIKRWRCNRFCSFRF